MAPLPDLHPIVIPPIEVKVGNKTFSCAGDGLLKDGHGYESNLKPFLPLSEPKKNKSGNVTAKQPVPQSKPFAFWKAQCAFRNFVQNGTIEALQGRLGGTDPKMDKDLAKEQTRVNKEFRFLNDQARRKNWSTLTTDEDKASVDPERFLRDRFFRQTAKKPSAKGDAVVLKTNDRIKIHQAAGPLDLFTESTEAPLEADGSVPRIDRWIVVGTSKAVVSEKIREINRPPKHKAVAVPKIKPGPPSSAIKREAKATTVKKEPQAVAKPPPKRKREASPPGSSASLIPDGSVRKKQTARKPVGSEKFVGPFLSSESAALPIAPAANSHAHTSLPKYAARKSVNSPMWPETSQNPRSKKPNSFAKAHEHVTKTGVKKESADSKSQTPWDVTGKWRVYCQALEDGWGSSCGDDEYWMSIYCTKEGTKYQLWAVFDWGVFTGVFRFMEPQSSSEASSATKQGSGHRVKREPDSDGEEFGGGDVFDDMDDDDDDDDDDDIRDEHAPVPASSFSLSSLPSPSHPMMPFRWRGEETGEGEIQLGDDEYPCSMTFSAGGVKCNGTFVSGIASTVQFSSLKVEDVVARPLKTPQEEWKERSEKAYERARVSRWGGWHGYDDSSDDDDEEGSSRGWSSSGQSY